MKVDARASVGAKGVRVGAGEEEEKDEEANTKPKLRERVRRSTNGSRAWLL
jgi:hypothetical protein